MKLSDMLERARTLSVLGKHMEALRRRGSVSLRQALEELGLLDAGMLDALQSLDPSLLRDRSRELVSRRLITAQELDRGLAMAAGLCEVDALHFEIDPHLIELLPPDVALAHRVLPLGVVGDHLYVAASQPYDEELRHTLSLVLGRHVILVWGAQADIDARLGAKSSLRRPPPAPVVPKPALTTPIPSAAPAVPATRAVTAAPPRHQPPPVIAANGVEQLVSLALSEVDQGLESEQSDSTSENSSIVRLVRKIIQDAQDAGASDIHVESNPGNEPTRIRIRRDGDMESYCDLPASLHAPLVSRLKIMARLDISERRRPQDGKINFGEFGGSGLELRVAIMPTHDGLEDVVMRLLVSTRPIPLANLGLQERDVDTIRRMSSRTYGLILAAGPTGSGKTTTLHSLLREVNTPERKIWTAEDPIEITHPGLRQVQMNAKIGLNFAAAMRSFLRADPDIIMIGEIRDEETAKVAIEASLTGHLVLSTLHTNSASESVVRLLDLGMDAFNFADSLVGIIAQRLVRGLCPKCSREQTLLPEEFDSWVREYCDRSPIELPEGRERLLIAAGVREPEQIRLRVAVGCEACAGKGYKGRMGVYEILESSPDLRALIQEKARPSEIFELAVRQGMRSLRHDAIEKLFAGRLDVLQARIAYR